MDFVEINGTAIRCEVTGEGPRTLVLVHEMGGTLESWDEVVPLVQPGRRVLRYDTRGAGLSEKLRGPVTFDTMADDLMALLDALGIAGPVALAGCAVGAGIALHFAARFPARATAVIAMAPATGVATERRAAALARAEAIARDGLRAGMDSGFDGSYPAEMRGDADRFRRFRARWLGNDAASYAAIYRMLAHATVTDELPSLQTPALLLAGVHDALRPPALVQGLAHTMPNARFAAIESAHYMPVQTPGLVAAAINGFLAEHGC